MTNYKTGETQHPLWQKRASEIKDLDSWTCQSCGSKTTPLHVHHIFYCDHKEPWDYPDRALITWCEVCHGANKDNRTDYKVLLGYTIDETGFSSHNICDLTDALIEFRSVERKPPGLIIAIFELILKNDKMLEMCEELYHKLKPKEVQACIEGI